MAKIISVVEKPIAENVSEEAYFLGIQDNGDGKQALCRMPYDKVCRQLNDLTDEDIQKVKDAALHEVTEVAQNAQAIADDLAERAENGEFNGTDYILTPADKQEIAEQAAALAGAMQGGTVTYKIPKECYETQFGNDPNDSATGMITIDFGEVVLNMKQLYEDIEAGVIEMPDGGDLAKMDPKILEKYVSYDLKPWVPAPRKSWVELVIDGTFEISSSYGQFTMFLNKIWNNDFKVSIHAKNSNGETANICVKSDIIHYTDLTDMSIGAYPLFGATNEFNEDMTIQTYNLALIVTFSPVRYGSIFGSLGNYVTEDDVKEVTITFIPSNTVVEEYENV